MTVYGLPEFSRFGCDPAKFKKQSANEYHGECPLCKTGTDRFVIFTDREYPHWRWFCRVCNPDGGWIDELNPNIRQPLSPEKAADYAQKREESLKREIIRAQAALQELHEAQAWERYHQQLTQSARNQWESWGIPPFWQDYWKLGFDPDHIIWTGEIEWHTPTMTIPLFEPVTWEVLNIRHRLMKPPKPGDKYRPEKSGLPAVAFVADPDREIKGKLLCVEGEKKGMVAYVTADDPNMQVIGIPGKNPPPSILKQIDQCEPIYICMDPDASKEARQMALKLGKERCRLIELPDKIDDLIIKHRLGKPFMQQTIRQAVKL